MSATAASIGLLLLAVTARTTCTSTTMATSSRRTDTIARSATLSVVSENQNNFNKRCQEAQIKQGFLDNAF